MTSSRTFIVIILLLLAASRSSSAAESVFGKLWSGFSTSLAGRSAEQRHNAALAAEALNGIVIPPGGRFSFNNLVGARESSKGYTEAPMIAVDGTLKDVPGGGICQLATTLYNAALLAGLTIVERHPHSRAIPYVPPGRDATIVSWRKDLKLANPHPLPLLLKINLVDERINVAFWGIEAKPFNIELRSETSVLEPDAVVVRGDKQQTGTIQPGNNGFAVITHRITSSNGVSRSELISDDKYPPPSRLISMESP